jgi:ABC-2 type transport system ATP-binding protein
MPTPETGHPANPIDVTDARKRFGAVEALAGASFQVRRGELVGLLGPNGAGKTTMIRASAGRVALDSGEVRVFGRVVGPRDPRPEIGVVPQELAIYGLLTARENLEVFAKLYGVKDTAIKERVDWALAWSDLTDRSKEPVKGFSGGMKRRLNIAIGLLHAPNVVLLDEPTVGVDPQSRERIYEMLAALQKSGVAVVLTTHHLEEAERRCERIVIIDHGKIVAAGTLGELLSAARAGGRTLTMALESAWPVETAVPAEISLSEDRRTVTTAVQNGGADVAARIDRLTRLGGKVQDLSLAGASLQDVFIGLTGRELRE